ncbi:sugar-binding transcriptional regulator [Planomicrobium sp. YIM 101495]|uniref:sugar-binding transcriptional regulator n=1 Tax=Planomicrobium sp. YIM 101495 TaxID=2665160 RepID=UPI0012B6B202|nr:sugar-binding domain-containing protein [Planomicrobium sp. YIM 101495]MTD31686.1 hypothetical protein [Planomicrobium sp. YIM 101495]
MESIFSAQQKLFPEMEGLLLQRYRMLEMIELEQPVGRRTLTGLSEWKERDVRRETEILRDQRLIRMEAGGMVVTDGGVDVLRELKSFVHELAGMAEKEAAVREALGIARVIVVPHDSDEQVAAKAQIGREAAEVLEALFQTYRTVAVTGGSTIAAIGTELTTAKLQPTIRFLAARGGLGGEAGHQANMIASAFADKVGGTVKTLYVPDQLSPGAFETLMNEPMIKDMITLYDEAEVVVHGIGNAFDLAKRRNATEEELETLKQGGAVSEAFGYYFDRGGEVVYRLRTAGIQLRQVNNAAVLLAVAGGSSKAEAIVSYFKNAPKQTILVTDEGAADSIIALTKTEEEL